MTASETVGHSDMARVSGHVHSLSKAALKDAEVTCFGKKTRTLADGFFSLNGLPAGKAKLEVTLQCFKSASKAVTLREGKETTAHLRLSPDTGEAKICGYVYDLESKKTVRGGGTVILVLPIANKYAHVDSKGFYEFAGLPNGSYKLAVSVHGYEENVATVTVSRKNETKKHDFFCRVQEVEEPPWG